MPGLHFLIMQIRCKFNVHFSWLRKSKKRLNQNLNWIIEENMKMEVIYVTFLDQDL